jgi:hypothetical protein
LAFEFASIASPYDLQPFAFTNRLAVLYETVLVIEC